MSSPLFFIAILPDAVIQAEITGFKKECGRLFQASHALNAPPHLTLVPPFRWPEQRIDEIKSVLNKMTFTQRSFSIALHGFNSFPPRVLYVDVLPNEELHTLKTALDRELAMLAGWKKKPYDNFHPHLTIAHRDLAEDRFPEARDYFSQQTYRRTFRAAGLDILRHTGKKWEVLAHFRFGEQD